MTKNSPLPLSTQQCELINLLHFAVNKLYQNDKDLIALGRVERACMFRIGLYLHEALYNSSFADLVVDSEYNRYESNVKKIYSDEQENSDKTVWPDLILHTRGKQENNALIVECKKSDDEDGIKKDFAKLKEFTVQNGKYAYKLGVFVKLEKNKPIYRYFINGEEVLEQTVQQQLLMK